MSSEKRPLTTLDLARASKRGRIIDLAVRGSWGDLLPLHPAVVARRRVAYAYWTVPRVLVMASAARSSTPLGRFIRLDGDHRAQYRVVQFLIPNHTETWLKLR